MNEDPHEGRDVVSQANLVLIVEDSAVQGKIIRNQVQALTELQTLLAATMEETADLLESQGKDIAVAVVDLNLPDAPDGEAVDLVLQFNIPTIVLTASFNEKIRHKFIEKRVTDYFFKGSIKDMDPMVDSLERIVKNKNVKAMVVDDSRFERSYMRGLLENQNFQVIIAGNGQEALEALQEHPDMQIIITDYEMPVMDGVELTKQVRETYKKDKLAIVGVSAAGSGALSALFLKNGANDFLTKPFEVEEFYCRINKTLDMMDIIFELQACYEQL